MRFARLDLLRYGGFTDTVLALPSAPVDFHLIVGANEAGKSTLRKAIAELLFGIELRSPQNWKHAYPEMRLGAQLAQGEHRLEIIRTKGNKNTLRDAADQPLPDNALAAFLGRADQAFFERMYALDQAGLVAGGRTLLSASDDLGRMLFQSAAGLSHLGELEKLLQARADTLWGPKKKAGRAYHDALEAFESAERALKQATVRSKDWAQAHTEHLAADQAHEQVLQQRRAGAARISTLQRIRRVRHPLARLAELESQLAAFATVVDLGEGARATLQQAQRMIFEAQEAQRAAAVQREELQRQIDSLPVDERLLDAATEIAALNDRRIQVLGHADEVARAQAQLAAHASEARRLAGELDLVLPADDAGAEAVLRANRLPLPSRAALAQLASQQDPLAQTSATAEAQLDRLRRSLAHLQGRLADLGPTHTEAALVVALDTADRLGDVAQRSRELQTRWQAAERAHRAALVPWARWPLHEDALRALRLPPAEAAQRHLAQVQALEAELRSTGSRRAQLEAELARLTAAIQNFQRAHQTVDPADLLQVRRQRDTLWASIEADPASVPAVAPHFRELVRDADRLADDRLATADAANQLRGQQDRQHELRAEVDALLSRQQALAGEQAALADAWAGTVAALGLPDLRADELGEWRALHQQLQATDGVLAQAVAAQAEWTQACTALAEALAALVVAPAPPSDPTQALPLLIEQARRQQRAAEAAAATAAELHTQIRQAQSELQTQQAALDAARLALQAWSAAWQQALHDAGLPTDWRVVQAQAVLAVHTALDTVLADMDRLRRETLQHRAEQSQALRKDTLALLARLGQASDRSVDADGLIPAASAGTALAALHQRAQHALRNHQARAEALARGVLLDRRVEEAAGTLRQAQARLQPLMSLSGVTSEAELAQRIAASDARRALLAEQAQLAEQLAAAGDGLPVAALRAECDAIDPSRLVEELQALEAQDEQVLATLSGLAARRQQARAALEAIGDSADAARAEGDRQQAIASMADAMEEYIQVKTAERLLKWSVERYRESQQGPMLSKASSHFAQMTRGSFDRLVVDFEVEPPRLEGRRPDGRLVPVEGMSDGTRDQLFLALRLAGLELQLASGPGLPFVADDLFVNFDDERSAAGLRALGALARQTQVIFLTHHDHLVGPARTVLGEGLNVIRL